MVQTGHVQWVTILYAIPLALNTEAILHSNNTRDLESDRRAGIVTLAILIGSTASEVLYAIFLFAPYTIFAVWGMKYSIFFFLPLITIPEAFRLERHFRTVSKGPIPKRTAKLNTYLGFLYVLGCALSDPSKLPFILWLVGGKLRLSLFFLCVMLHLSILNTFFMTFDVTVVLNLLYFYTWRLTLLRHFCNSLYCTFTVFQYGCLNKKKR